MTTKKTVSKSKKTAPKPKKPTPKPRLYRTATVEQLKGGNDLDFSKANLSDKEIRDTFVRCNFAEANLAGLFSVYARFQRCNFTRASLNYSHFVSCGFNECDFTATRVGGAAFVNCTFHRVALSKEFLERASLLECYFENCTLPDGVPVSMQRLPTGQFTAYKSVRGETSSPSGHYSQQHYVLELLVPRSAQRVIGLNALNPTSSNAGKCRVSKAKVVRVFDRGLRDITGLSTTPKQFHSRHNYAFTYEVGKWVKPDIFDADPAKVCSNGIHVFLYPEQAAAY